MSYTPHPQLSLASADQDSSLFVPTSDWWMGVTDQFAMGGSAAMTSYSERVNVPLIALLANEAEWKLWAEPLVAQVAVADGLRVVPFRHVYNVLRHIATRASSWTDTYTPSRCVWIWYGQQAMADHCPHWLSRQQRMLDVMLDASHDTASLQAADEPYANRGRNARRALLQYVHTLNSATHQQSAGTNASASTSASASSVGRVSAASSNYYYFWRYRSAAQAVGCEQPAHSVYPEIAASAEAVQPADHPPFSPYRHHYYPFLTTAADQHTRSAYQQHVTCEQQ